MPNDDFQDSVPADRLGRMLVLSMVFHLALFAGLVWYNFRTPKSKLLVPTYTVDLVNMPLSAPGPKTVAAPESSPPGAVAKPAGELTEAGRHQPVEKKPVPQMKITKPSPPPAKTVPAPPQPHPKVTGPPPKTVPQPLPAVPKPAEPPTPAPALKPAVEPKKAVAPKAVAETRQPPAPVKKPVPEAVDPAAELAKAKARERQLAQEINAAQQKVAESSRKQKIQESVQDVEKALAAKSRDRGYKEAVGQAAARLSAGKVNAKVSQGGGGDGGSMGSAQTAAYGAQVSLTVRRHWQPNCLQRSNMQNLKAVIIVRIQADGSISASWFEKESGDRLFDQSAITAVTRSSPLAPLPPGQEKLEIGITFTPEWKASS